MLSQALLDRDHDQIPRGPGGDPVTFGLDGTPITTRAAITLSEDTDHCTLVWTPIRLPESAGALAGSEAVVRTLFIVFDDEASKGPVPEGHVPQLYASDLYTAGPEGRFVRRLWTYGSADEAKAGHPEAVAEFQSGRARAIA